MKTRHTAMEKESVGTKEKAAPCPEKNVAQKSPTPSVGNPYFSKKVESVSEFAQDTSSWD